MVKELSGKERELRITTRNEKSDPRPIDFNYCGKPSPMESFNL